MKKLAQPFFCPITSKIKGYPFEVKVKGKKINVCVLSHQIKSLDWTLRNIELIERAEKVIVEEVIAKALTLLT